MKFSYNWLKEFVPFKETAEELAEFLTMRAFEVESVEKKGDDFVLDVKIFPNRIADCSGHWGLAKEIAFLKKLRTPNSELRTQPAEDKKKKAADFVRIKIKDSDDCPRYTARVMTDVAVKPSPQWLTDRLETCGIQSINNIVDAANYVMLELGQPLHVFDLQKLPTTNHQPPTIFVRRARKGEQLLALDDKTYELMPDILVIADEKAPIAIAGIKGGKHSGISDSTKIIILESANFNPARIRAGSQLLKLKTDASIRFEHGMSPHGTEQAIDRLAQIIQEVAGGSILKGRADAYTKKYISPRILFRKEYADCMIGKELPLLFYKDACERLGAFVNAKGKNQLIVQPPPARLDLQREEDFIEEAARLFGYENIPAKTPEAALLPPHESDELFWTERIQNILAGAGFTETALSSFASDRELDQFFLDREGIISVANPANPEAAYLVPRAVIHYVVSTADNLRHADSVKLFGIAKNFSMARGAPQEQKKLILSFARKGSGGEAEFYELKGAVDAVLKSLGISDFWYDDSIESHTKNQELRFFHPYRVAQIKIGEENLGNIGEIHPAVRENIKAKTRLAVAEIDFALLWKAARAEAEYRPVGKYPAIVRDIAVVVPERTKTEEITNIIEEYGAPLLIDSDLFDYFQDEELTARGTKSLAFHLIFQSPERTLKDEEVNAAIERIVAALEKQGWVVRK